LAYCVSQAASLVVSVPADVTHAASFVALLSAAPVAGLTWLVAGVAWPAAELA
jgi:hypothetical protein